MNQTMHTFFLVYYPRVTMINNQSGNQTNSFGSISFGTGNKALWFGDVTGALSDELISINSDSPLDVYHGATASVSPEPHLFAIRYTNNKMTIYLDGEVKIPHTEPAMRCHLILMNLFWEPMIVVKIKPNTY